MSQDLSQVFYVDSAIVKSASKVFLNSVTLFFRAKPDIQNNKSGIYAPGAHLYVVPAINNIPEIDPLTTYPMSNMAYGQIVDSADASIPTVFAFGSQVPLDTDSYYAFILKFDGAEDFYLWTNVKGYDYLGTQTPSSGATAKYVGPLYGYISSNASLSNTQSYLDTNWKPIDGTTLKFSIDVARYSYDNILISNSSTNSVGNSLVVVSNNSIQIKSPSYPTEYVYFDRKRSNINNVLFGDTVYQDQPYYPGNKATPATCSVTAGVPVIMANTNYLLSNGSNFSFSRMFDYAGLPEYIVVTSLNHDGAGLHRVDVKMVTQSYNNNQGIICDSALSFSNSNAYFFKSPVGRLNSMSRIYSDGNYNDLVIIKDSNANATCRFVNNCINAVSINAGGSGYANSDYVTVSGYEDNGAAVSGGYVAVANISTNSTGGIATLYFGNTGAGFVNTAAITYTIKNANNTTSAGTGANLTFTSDSVIKTQSTGGNVAFYGSKIINLDFGQMMPVADIEVPSGVQYSLSFTTPYYQIYSANTLSGKEYYIDANAASLAYDVTNYKTLSLHNNTRTPILPSRSNQFSIRYANGSVANTSTVGQYFSNSSILNVTVASNNDFVIGHLSKDSIDTYYDKYNINNDYTGEEGNYGNAVSKAVSVKVNLQTDQFAEDMLVYLTAFRPSTTDFKVYSRMYNSHDPDAFDDKDWTLLEQVDGIGVYSILSNQSDMKEYTYNLVAYPNNAWVDTGTVTTQLGNNVIVGSGTHFANLNVNDLVKIYSPLFPNSNYMISVVNAVTNNTQLTLSDTVSNNSMTGAGFKITKIGYPHQVFNDIQNDNVATYYNNSMTKFTTFDTFQMKIVFLSPDNHIVPKIDDIEVDAVSA